MRAAFRLGSRRWYPAFFGISALALNSLVLWSAPASKVFELVFGATTLIAGLMYFLFTQHLQETKLFTELFATFNGRFDKLNEPLNAILRRNPENPALSLEQEQVLFDYFNLCAEEYLYFRSGYIDPEVWMSWSRGMAVFAGDRAVRALWEQELNTGSYYGFSLTILPSPSAG